MTPALLAWVYFGDRVSLYAWDSLDCIPSIYASCIAEITGTHYHPQLLLVEMGSFKRFVWAALES
jgi:hypothetical protein